MNFLPGSLITLPKRLSWVRARAVRLAKMPGAFKQRHLLPRLKRRKAVASQGDSTVQVRISRDFNNKPNDWFWSVEVTKGAKSFVMKGSAPSRFHAEAMTDEFAAQILNPEGAAHG